MGGLRVRTTLAVGASQSAGRMTVYYQSILPKGAAYWVALTEGYLR